MKKVLPRLLRRWLTRLYLTSKFDVKLGRATAVSHDTVFGGMNLVMDECEISSSDIGLGTYVASRSVLRRVKIGKFCSIGSGVKMSLGQHPSSEFVSTHPAFFSLRRQAGFTFVYRRLFEEHSYANEADGFTVEVGNDVWIGDNAIIMDSVRVGNGAIVGAGAVVTRDIAPYSINIGVPARLLRFRFDSDIVDLLQQFRWWDKELAWIRANHHLFSDVKVFLDAVCETQGLS